MSGLENVKILFFIKRTKPTKTGDATIFVRITINKERTEFSLKKHVNPKNWDDKKERAKGRTPEIVELNEFIDQYQRKILSYIDFMILDNQTVTARIIQEKLVGKKETRRTILKIFQEHNDNARKLIGIDFAPDTIQRYETSYMHTKEFIRWQYQREDMALEDLNHQFVRNYELYLKTERKCAHNTAIKYLKNFKKIVRIALANGWMKKDPFATVKFKLKPVDAVFLTSQELEYIRTKEITISRIAQVRDVFLFCCFTGLAFSDVKTLRQEHITKEDDGTMWIHKKRQKTNQMSTVYLLEPASALLKKYQNTPDLIEKGILLPVLSNQKMNLYLKEIADICGIEKTISTHTARHTYATTVSIENDIPLEVLSKSLGHSNIKMTQRYGRTTETFIKRHMQKLAQVY